LKGKDTATTGEKKWDKKTKHDNGGNTRSEDRTADWTRKGSLLTQGKTKDKPQRKTNWGPYRQAKLSTQKNTSERKREGKKQGQ